MPIPLVTRVLVADDHPIIRSGLKKVLDGTSDLEVIAEAEDGAEAVEKALAEDVHLAILDVSMPGMTGTELAKIMTERWPAIPVLLISGQGVPPADYRGGFLPKPFLPDTLVAGVRALLPSMGVEAEGQESAAVRAPFGAPWWAPRLPVG